MRTKKEIHVRPKHYAAARSSGTVLESAHEGMSELQLVPRLTPSCDSATHVSSSNKRRIRSGSELERILVPITSLFVVLAVLWVLFYIAWSRLPYIREGADIIYQAKEQCLKSGDLLNKNKSVRILIFGNSKVLSGFRTHLFEKLAPNCSAYNLGLPNAQHFIPELNALLQRGEAPTHVLITIPWAELQDDKPAFFHPIPSDSRAMDALFPFRRFLNDGIIFLYRSRHFGGPVHFYEYAGKIVREMEKDKGYYFIAEQSRYVDNKLPPFVHIDSDTNRQAFYRPLDSKLNSFTLLRRLANEHGFIIWLVPIYFRAGEFAPPEPNASALKIATDYPGSFNVLGPEYFLYPNAYFSDLVHLNPSGAEVYTTQLAALVTAKLSWQSPSPHRSKSAEVSPRSKVANLGVNTGSARIHEPRR